MDEVGAGIQHPLLNHPPWDWESILHHLSFILFPLALLWRPLFAGEAFFWGTPLLQFIPWQQLAADMWRSGHLPLWNPLVGCGAPLAANYQTAAFYPLNALHLLIPAEVALSWTVVLHLALTGWGMYRWGRAAGLDRFPALIGALALEGSGFLVARVALFPSIAITFPWISIWLWRAEALVQRGNERSESGGASLQDVLWLGLAIGLGLLAGHAQTACYGGLLVAAYSIFRARHPFRTSRPLLLSLILGLGLAAVQLLPTAELLVHSQRSTGVSDGLAMTYSFWPWRLITIVAPGFFGSSGYGNYWGYAAHWEDAVYMGVLPFLLAVGAGILAFRRKQGPALLPGLFGLRERRDGDDENLVTGASPSAVDRPLARFWIVSAVVALTLALGKNTPVFPFLFHHVPGLDLFQAPTRWSVVATVALAALTGIGAHHWPRGHRARQRGALGATVGGALLIGGLAAPRLISTIPATFGPATARLGIALILTGILSFLRLRACHPTRDQSPPGQHPIWWQAAVGAFVALDLLTFGWPLVPTVDRSLYHGSTDTAKALRAEREHVRLYWPSDPTHQDQRYDAQYRVKFSYLTFDNFGPASATYWREMRADQLPNAGMLDGIASANNFDPLLVEEYADLLEAAVETPRILDAMGVTHVVSDRPWSEGLRIHTTESAAFYRLPGTPGRAWVVPYAKSVHADEALEAMRAPSFDPTSTVLVEDGLNQATTEAPDRPPGYSLALQDGPNRVTIEAVLEAPGYLVLADTWYPGWQVTVDGEPAALLWANHAFRAVQLQRGQHLVEMTYRPPSVLLGQWISLVCLGAVTIGSLCTFWRKKADRIRR